MEKVAKRPGGAGGRSGSGGGEARLDKRKTEAGSAGTERVSAHVEDGRLEDAPERAAPAAGD